MALKPINDVPEADRTEARDQAANEILEYLQAGNSFNAELLADIGGWSPQHYRNTRDAYFKEVDDPRVGEKELASDYQDTTRSSEVVADGSGEVIEIQIPPEITDKASYLHGYIEGVLSE